MKHILSVTGIRAEYDIMSSVYRAIEDHDDLQLSLIVTGSHLSKTYGDTVAAIEADGFSIAERVDSLLDSNRDAARIKGAAIQMYGLAQAIDRVRPDMLMVFGDREETITTALIGSYMNIPVMHLSGGDRVVGNVDDQVRHAVTKLSHVHCTTSQASADRILKMGEQPFRVHNTGNPGLDRLAQVPQMDRAELLGWYGFPKEMHEGPLLLLIQHVISTEIDQAYEQMRCTMEAIDQLGWKTVISYPNSDAGSADLIRCLDEYKDRPFIQLRRHIPRLEFVNTMRHANCMVGNSSAGLLEAPFLHLPAVNVGNRQKARMHTDNIEFVPHDVKAIMAAVRKGACDEAYRAQVAACECPFGDGTASQKITKILAGLVLDDHLLIKDITY